jgi:hypothetical protein
MDGATNGIRRNVEFKKEPGRKGPGDEIISVRTVSGIEKGPWEKLTMADLGQAAVLLSENEEVLKRSHPHWYRGGKKIYDFLRDCGRYGFKSACVRHQLTQVEFNWLGDNGETSDDQN